MRPAPPLRATLVLLGVVLAVSASPSMAAGQEPEADERAAVLRAMMILKIAPYLVAEPRPPAPAPRADGEPPKPAPPKPPPQREPPPPQPQPPKPEPPKPATPTFRIALCGRDDVTAAAARHLPQKRVGAAVVETVEVTAAVAAAPRADEPRPYDLLYLAHDTPPELIRRIVAAHRDDPIPIVCERRGFVAAGGGVQLFVQDNTLRFEINPEALRRQGVRASPQLLKLSREAPR